MLQRLTNDALGRLLHEPLYARLVAFCQEHSPEFPADVVVEGWMQRLYRGDSNLHILVRLDSQYQIVGHAVIDVQTVHGQTVVWCYQAQGNKANLAELSEGVEYIDKLVSQVQAHCSIFVVAKHVTSLGKKYGYKAIRTVMMKVVDDDPVGDD